MYLSCVLKIKIKRYVPISRMFFTHFLSVGSYILPSFLPSLGFGIPVNLENRGQKTKKTFQNIMEILPYFPGAGYTDGLRKTRRELAVPVYLGYNRKHETALQVILLFTRYEVYKKMKKKKKKYRCIWKIRNFSLNRKRQIGT
jgi:hypothetical protein